MELPDQFVNRVDTVIGRLSEDLQQRASFRDALARRICTDIARIVFQDLEAEDINTYQFRKQLFHSLEAVVERAVRAAFKVEGDEGSQRYLQGLDRLVLRVSFELAVYDFDFVNNAAQLVGELGRPISSLSRKSLSERFLAHINDAYVPGVDHTFRRRVVVRPIVTRSQSDPYSTRFRGGPPPAAI